MALFALTFLVLLLAFAGLAIGVILTEKKELSGSCGGPSVNEDCCQTCPNKDACEDGDAASALVDPVDVPLIAERDVVPSLAQHP